MIFYSGLDAQRSELKGLSPVRLDYIMICWKGFKINMQVMMM